MASVPVKQAPAVKPAESIEQQLRRLESLWTAETGYLSDPGEIVNHAAFREIISMGDVVVPFMMRDLQERPRLWVWALPDITGADPVSASDRGNIRKMSEAWLVWGKEHGYQW
jgi:hypothetical protein